MSMRTYAVNDYGLYITEQQMEKITENYNKELSEEERFESDELADEMGLTFYSDVEGEFVPFDKGLESIDLDCDLFFILSLDKAKSLFMQAYKNIDEVEAEVRNKVFKYIGCDFNYRSQLGEIIGTVFE